MTRHYRASAVLLLALFVGMGASCGDGGVDPDALAEAVQQKAQESWEFEDDFHRVDQCAERAEGTYECRVTGDDGEQFIDIHLVGDGRFRVDEPLTNTNFQGELP